MLKRLLLIISVSLLLSGCTASNKCKIDTARNPMEFLGHVMDIKYVASSTYVYSKTVVFAEEKTVILIGTRPIKMGQMCAIVTDNCGKKWFVQDNADLLYGVEND